MSSRTLTSTAPAHRRIFSSIQLHVNREHQCEKWNPGPCRLQQAKSTVKDRMQRCPFTTLPADMPGVEMAHMLSKNSEYFDSQELYEDINGADSFPDTGTCSEDNLIPLHPILHRLLDRGLRTKVNYTVTITEEGYYDLRFASETPAWAKKLETLGLREGNHGNWRSRLQIELSDGQLRFVRAGNLERQKVSELLLLPEKKEKRKITTSKLDRERKHYSDLCFTPKGKAMLYSDHTSERYEAETSTVKQPRSTDDITTDNWKAGYTQVLMNLKSSKSKKRFARLAVIQYELRLFRFLNGDPTSLRSKGSVAAMDIISKERFAVDKDSNYKSIRTRMGENLKLAMFAEKYPRVMLLKGVKWSFLLNNHKYYALLVESGQSSGGGGGGS